MLSGLKISSLSSWLSHDSIENKSRQYKHNLFKENLAERSSALEELIPVIQKAHDDARFKLRKFLQDDLDPLEDWNDDIDPAEGYPEVFDMSTLKGYFGEFFSGVLAENIALFDESEWRVPVFSFRWHNTAFDQLEILRQTGEKKTAIFGRTGDDCVAFVLKKGVITKVLFLEAKCSATHNLDMIADAHTKISTKNLIPVEIMRLVEILQDYDSSSEAKAWIQALRQLYRNNTQVQRYDCVSYIFGQSPIRPKTKFSWIDRDNPHPNYSGSRKLEVAEVHLTNVDDLIRYLYRKDE